MFVGLRKTCHLRAYQKQMLFAGVGLDGQQRLAGSHVLLVGCGALGCVVADTLVRAGVGRIRIVDRDFVELSNLQRQILFDEQDVAEHLPKVIAAERRLRCVNSEIAIEPIVADVDWSNIGQFTEGVSLILDGTDNFEIRYLINDVSLHAGIPWIFTGCTGSVGQVMPVFPHDSACLRLSDANSTATRINGNMRHRRCAWPCRECCGLIPSSLSPENSHWSRARGGSKAHDYRRLVGFLSASRCQQTASDVTVPCMFSGRTPVAPRKSKIVFNNSVRPKRRAGDAT